MKFSQFASFLTKMFNILKVNITEALKNLFALHHDTLKKEVKPWLL